MKHVLIILFLFAAIGCQKDEVIAPMLVQKSYKPVEFIPEEFLVELRTGVDELVWFDGSGVFAPATGSDSLQSPVNLRHIDSIRYVTDWNSPSIDVLGAHCWRYDITFYYNGNTLQRTAFAKYRGLQYTQIIGANEGWNSPVLFMHLVRRNQVFNTYFDDECMKDKLQHQYLRRVRNVDGSSVITEEYLKSNACNRNAVRYDRRFKP